MTEAQMLAGPGDAPATDLEPVVRATNLTKAYGDTVAARDLTFEIARGSVTAVVGPNGAGKSTTFLMLATLLMPTSGEASVCGYDVVVEAEEVRARLGYMPDFFGIYDDLRVDEYLDFFAASYGIGPTARARLTTDLLELVNLTTKRTAAVNTLSRGMKQRLCLARALVHDPEVLILDEPASGLDPRARIELRGTLQHLQQMGKTIVISSHILSELEDICTDVLILEAGSLVTAGSASALLAEMATGRRFAITVARGELERLADVVAGIDDVELSVDEARGAELLVAGDDDEVARLLARIVAAGIPVTGFTELRAGFEEIFLRATKGIVR